VSTPSIDSNRNSEKLTIDVNDKKSEKNEGFPGSSISDERAGVPVLKKDVAS
jgi:hypothetical protein